MQNAEGAHHRVPRPRFVRAALVYPEAGGRASIPKNAFGCRIPAGFRVRVSTLLFVVFHSHRFHCAV